MARALVVSGGGAKGAFAVGALKRLARNPANLAFDIVAGTSIGAVIAPFVVAGEIDLLEELFRTLKSGDVVRRLDRILSMFKDGYVYHSEQLRKRLQESITTDRAAEILSSSTTTTFFATVCLQTGRVTYFHAGRAPAARPASSSYDLLPIADRKELIEAVMASANMPVLMGPIVKRGGRQYVDGGVRAYAPFEIAIDQGAREIWAVLHSPAPADRQVQTTNYRRLDAVAERTVGLLTADVGDNDLELAGLKADAAGVTLNVLRPAEDIEERFKITALDFSPPQMQKLVDYGEERAKERGW